MTFAGDASRRVMYFVSPSPTESKPLANNKNVLIIVLISETHERTFKMTKQSASLYGTGKEKVAWAMNHWTRNYKDELVGASAYSIAQQVGMSARQMNRILAQWWWEGKVSYREEGGRKFGKRVWCWTEDAKDDRTKGWCMSEAAKQQGKLRSLQLDLSQI